MSENPADDDPRLDAEAGTTPSLNPDDASPAGEVNAASPSPTIESPANPAQSSGYTRSPTPVSVPPRPARSGPPRASTSRPPHGSFAASSTSERPLAASHPKSDAPPQATSSPRLRSSAPPGGEPIIARRVIKLEEPKREVAENPPKRSSGSTPAIETTEASIDDFEVDLNEEEFEGLGVIPKAPAMPTSIDPPLMNAESSGVQAVSNRSSEAASTDDQFDGATQWESEATPPTPVASESEELRAEAESSPAPGAWSEQEHDAEMAAEELAAPAPRNSVPAAMAEAYTFSDFEEDVLLETDEPPEVFVEAERPPESEPGEAVEDVESVEQQAALEQHAPPLRSAPAMPEIPAAERKPPPPRRSAKPSLPRATEPRKKPWWETLFGDDFSRAYRPMTERQLKREVDFITKSLGLPRGAVILDLGCGQGEICVELARRGYSVVGYDLSVYQLAMAGDHAQAARQKINFLQGDMREMAFEQMFDAVLCWDTSFGYFEEDKNFDVLQRIRSSLKPGGRFLLDVMNRDFAARESPYNHWFEGDGCVCMDDMVMDWITNRLKVKRSIILDDGRSKELQYSVRLYGLSDVGRLLHDAGFRVASVSGDVATEGAFFGPHSRRIIIQSTAP